MEPSRNFGGALTWSYFCDDEAFPGTDFWLESECKETKVDKCLTANKWNMFNSRTSSDETRGFNLPVSVSCGKHLQCQIQSKYV